MTLDKRLLSKARQAHTRWRAQEQELERLKTEYHAAIRGLHEAGGTLREIASALDLSFQRVHQIVDAPTSGWRYWLGRRKLAPKQECSFCAASDLDSAKLVAGPDVYICDRCVGLVARVVRSGSTASDEGTSFAMVDPGSRLRCSFCRRTAKGDRRLVSGAGRQICDECLHLCQDILEDRGK